MRGKAPFVFIVLRRGAGKIDRLALDVAQLASSDRRTHQPRDCDLHARHYSRLLLKNSTNTGASARALTACVCPSSVRYSAFGRMSASARFPRRIQQGLLPPSITSVATATEAQRPARTGFPP